MTRADREHLLQRYLEGAMSSAEEEEFLIRAALNTDLRMELKAHQTIDRALRKDRTSGMVEHTALRARMAASLSASAVPQSVTTTTAPAAATTVAGGAASWSIWGGSAVLGGLSVIVALVLVLNPFASETPQPRVRPANTILMPAPSAPSLPLQNSTKEGVVENTEQTSQTQSAAPAAARDGQSTSSASARRATSSNAPHASERRSVATDAARNAENPSDQRTTSTRRSTRNHTPIDVGVDVSINVNKDSGSNKTDKKR